MLSELATNAVQHAATEFEVAVRVAPDGGRVRVEVSDERRRLPDAAGTGRPTLRTGAACTSCARWPTPGASRCGGTGPARRCGSRCRWRGASAAASSAAAERRRQRAAPRERTSGTTGGAPAGSRPAGRVARVSRPRRTSRLARPRRAGRARRAARRRRGHRRAGRDPLRQRAAEELLGWPHGSLVGRPSSTSCPTRWRRGGRRTTGRSSAPRPRPRRAPARCRHQAGRRHGRRHRAGRQHLRPPARRPRWSSASSAPATRRSCSAGRS